MLDGLPPKSATDFNQILRFVKHLFYICFSVRTVEVVTSLDHQNALISLCHDGICDSIQSNASTGAYTSCK